MAERLRRPPGLLILPSASAGWPLRHRRVTARGLSMTFAAGRCARSELVVDSPGYRSAGSLHRAPVRRCTTKSRRAAQALDASRLKTMPRASSAA